MKLSAIIDQTRQDHPIVRKQERNSSLELLRIVAMLMIVAFHFFRHGGFDFPEDSFTVNRIYYQFVLMFGNFGNAVFVFLSGYFLILSDRLKPQKLGSFLHAWSVSRQGGFQRGGYIVSYPSCYKIPMVVRKHIYYFVPHSSLSEYIS